MRYQEHLLDLQNRELKHDADGVVWEEDGERPATKADNDDGLDIPPALLGLGDVSAHGRGVDRLRSTFMPAPGCHRLAATSPMTRATRRTADHFGGDGSGVANDGR
jgi:hypothetical protein